MGRFLKFIFVQHRMMESGGRPPARSRSYRAPLGKPQKLTNIKLIALKFAKLKEV